MITAKGNNNNSIISSMSKLQRKQDFVLLLLQFFVIVKSFSGDQSKIGIKSNKFTTNYTLHSFKQAFRLPTSLTPTHYKLEIIPVLDDLLRRKKGSNSRVFKKFQAPGRIWIKFVCNENTNNITLHSSDIDISKSSIKVTKLPNNLIVPIKGFQVNKAFDFFIISLNKSFEKKDQYQIYIEFVSRVEDNRFYGLYADYYITKSTLQKRYLATTTFSPFHARKAFPCFDEPALRAPFDIIIGRSEKYHSLSNAEIIHSQPMSDTPDFQYIKHLQVGLNNHTTDIRVFAPKDLLTSQAGDYGLNITVQILTELENYFQVGFPMKKLYSVALPHLYYKAMENWGLITYRESIILNTSNVSTESDKFYNAYATSHEIAHQWFGNLVSPKWWTYLWLKEAFSFYFAFHAINIVLHEFEPWKQFTHKAFQLALEFDGGPSTHPLNNEPKNAKSVADIYSIIPYKKGGSILRMTSNFLTSHTFRKGMQKYIKKMKYTSAEPQDVYNALQEAADEDKTLSANATVKMILETWTVQSGFPLLRVTAAKKDQLIITQEKFIDNWTLQNEATTDSIVGKVKKSNKSTTDKRINNNSSSWWIPVTISTAIDTSHQLFWISKHEKSISLNISTNQLIIVNPHAIGYYRVLYDDNLLLRILYQLEINHMKIPTEARSQILDDYFKLSFAGYVSITDALLITNYLGKEKDYSVWKTLFLNLEKHYKLLSSTQRFSAMKEYLIMKIESVLNIDVLENSSGLQRLLQYELLEWACRLTQRRCVEYSILLMKKWQLNAQINPIVADIQSTVYCSSVNSNDNSSNTIWKFMLDRYEKEFFSVQKDLLLHGLTCTNNEKLLLQILRKTVDNKIKMEDRIKIVQNVVENPIGRNLAFKFVEANFKSLYNDRTANPVTECLKSLSLYFNTPDEKRLVEQFIKRHELHKRMKTVNQNVKTIEQNNKWVKEFGKPIHVWMEAKIATEKTGVTRTITRC